MKRFPNSPLAISGLVLLGSGVVLSSPVLERFLLGTASGALAWGPILFRTLLALHGLVLFGLAWVKLFGAAPPGNAWPRLSRSEWTAMFGLSIVALGLRLWRLDTCLWLDEILTMSDFARLPLGQLVVSFPNQNQHMLFSILAHLSMSVFGEHAWSLRIPSVLLGVASLWALFLLGRKVVGSREALFACALMTVSYHHVWFSQNARGYIGVLLFALLATWLWLEAISRNSWGLWISYALSLFLGMWIHMTMLFIIGTHSVIWLFDTIRVRRLEIKPLAAWALCGTLTLQVLSLSLPEFLRTALHETSMSSEWTNPLWVLTESLRSLRGAFLGGVVVLFGAVVMLLGWVSVFRRDVRAALCMVLPGLLAGISMLSLGHNLWPRFFFFCVGFALIIAIHGAMLLPQLLLTACRCWTPRLATTLGTASAVLAIVASALTLPRCYALPKQDFTGARDYVEATRMPGDAVVAVGLARHAYGKYYAPHWNTALTLDDLETIRRNHTAVTLVYTLPIELQAFSPQLWSAVQADFEPVKTFPGTLGGGEVYVCKARKHTGRNI